MQLPWCEIPQPGAPLLDSLGRGEVCGMLTTLSGSGKPQVWSPGQAIEDERPQDLRPTKTISIRTSDVESCMEWRVWR